METTTQVLTQKQLTTKDLFSRDDVKKRFEEMLGKKAQGFITSVLQIVASSDKLREADPASIYNAAAMAATLDLPLNNNLGYAYIVPYNVRQKDGSFKKAAQFQLGYKGFVQLAQRSGQFKTISVATIFEGQLVETNPLTGFVFDFTKKSSEKIIGFAAYFSLITGFEKTFYMTADEVQKHGSKYSKTFKDGLWKTDFEAMAQKTVLKLLISKYAPMSIEMQKATVIDQAVIEDESGDKVTYVDHEEVVVDKEAERILLMLKDCETIDDLELLMGTYPEIEAHHYEAQKAAIESKLNNKK